MTEIGDRARMALETREVRPRQKTAGLWAQTPFSPMRNKKRIHMPVRKVKQKQEERLFSDGRRRKAAIRRSDALPEAPNSGNA